MSGPAGTELLLGIDAGTERLKAALYTREGRCLGAGEAPQGVVSPRPGWVEQDPVVWWRGLARGVRAALAAAGVPGERVRAIGLSTQGGTLAVFDERGRPRGPALVWSDARQQSGGDSEPRRLDQQFRLTGCYHLNMTPAGLGWLWEHRPEWFRGRWRVGFVPDYLSYRLTGWWVNDPTNLAISNLCQLATLDIAEAVLARLGVPRAAFGETRRAGEAAGALLPAAAETLGLPAGIPVAVAAHDQYAAALGAGCVQPGDLLLSAGTAWVAMLVTARPVLDRRSSFWPGPHVVEGRWGLLGAISSGGSTLERVLALTRQRREWPVVDEGAERVSPGSDGLLVIPHLVGRTLPTAARHARGAILGLTLGHGREHLWRAAMEGVAFEARVACEYLARRGADTRRLRMVGGGARSPLWPRIVASVLGVPVEACGGEDIAARGAACLAARVAGLADLPRAVAWQEHQPEPIWQVVYEEIYQGYRHAIRRLEGPGRRKAG